jgi:aryl-alcohol dehydrogenase-like predicted oxidoreductase
MKHKPLGNSGLSASIVGLGAWVLAGGRNLQQVTDNARAGDLNLEAADLERIRRDVVNLGEPAKA